MTSCVLIMNMTAGPIVGNAKPEHLMEALSVAGLKPQLRTTDELVGAECLARDAASAGVDIVVVAGGDGTIREVVNALLGTSTRLCIVPCGTGNVLARELCLPMNVQKACALAANGIERVMDVGMANEQPFMICAGVGYDASVVRSTNQTWKRRIGKWAYVLATMRPALRTKPAIYNLLIDDEAVRASLWGVIVCNTARYAGRVRFCADARTDDGVLELCMLHDRGRPALLRMLLRLARELPTSSMDLEVRRIKYARIDTSPLAPVQLDGDGFQQTPLVVKVVPAAVRIMTEPHEGCS